MTGIKYVFELVAKICKIILVSDLHFLPPDSLVKLFTGVNNYPTELPSRFVAVSHFHPSLIVIVKSSKLLSQLGLVKGLHSGRHHPFSLISDLV
jgi:hypothetical protein